jgi:transposase InsO family protein
VHGRQISPTDPGQDRALASLKNRILLEHYYLQSDLERQVAAFVEHYNHDCYHESLDNLTPAEVYSGRGETILLERERIKRQTIANRRLQHQLRAA